MSGQSERQAVNSVIQGSAADIVKAAMVSMERAVRVQYPTQLPTLTSAGVVPAARSIRGTDEKHQFGVHLVLQLHDELMYEVSAP